MPGCGTGDVNGDGREDTLWSNGDSHTTVAWLLDNAGQLASAQDIGHTPAGQGVLRIKQKNGTTKRIRSLPWGGLNNELWAVGATYGVFKLPSDPPHWSSTGH